VRRAAFTFIEVLVASAVFLIIIAVLYGFLSRMFSTTKPSVTRMTSASFIRQDVRLAFQKLMDRLEEGIEILAPAPNASATELEFKDLLNHHTVLALTAQNELATFRVRNGAREPETTPESIPTAGGSSVAPLRPIRVPNAKKVLFHVQSPTLVTIVLTVSDANQTGNLVATARLRNSRLIEE
jgi:prepilin-type N-terminal cleavage/methylation domain-containing protein